MSMKTLAALAATMALALPAGASAGTDNMDVIVDGNSGAETRSVAVSVADLNLASASGILLHCVSNGAPALSVAVRVRRREGHERPL